MDYKKIFEKFENQNSLIKTTQKPVIDGAQKAALNRKGNTLLNSGGLEGAKRIFLTTGYSDGLSRIGDAYKTQNRYLEALEMYRIAPNQKKFDGLVKQLSAIIQNLMHEEGEPSNE
jgi:tetratricopeptide (TPR) repeat protein